MTILRAALVPVVLVIYAAAAAPWEAAVGRLWPRARGRGAMWLCRLLLAVLRIRVEAAGVSSLDPPRMIAANHVSWIDILVVGSLRPTRFLAKAEVGAWPLVAAIARAQGTIFVDRRRRRSIPPANAAILDALMGGETVAIFPEGTTNAAGAPIAFRSSHFQPACDAASRLGDGGAVCVAPLALSYDNPRAAWIGDAELLPHIWEMLRAPPSICRVTMGAPLEVDGSGSRKSLARAAGARVDALLRRGREETPQRGVAAFSPARC